MSFGTTFSEIHKSCYFQVLLTATTHHTHYKAPRSNSCFVEVCHIANNNKSIFCILLVIIILSLPSSFDRALNDQELRQHLNFNPWSDFNLQIQCDEPGKQLKSIGHGRKRRKIWYAMCLYGAELPALSLYGIEACHEVHPPSGARKYGALIPRGDDKRSARAGNNICLCATPVQWFQESFGHHQYRVHQLNSMDEMFPSHGMRDDLSEFFLIEIILNRRIVPEQNNNVAEPDPDSVVMVQAYGNGDLVDDVDFKYRTLVAFLPGAGVFSCARECRQLEVGCNKAYIQLDASWFRF
jgi:hypothetical protein